MRERGSEFIGAIVRVIEISRVPSSSRPFPVLAGALERHAGALERCAGALERRAGALARHAGAAARRAGALERHAGVLARRAGVLERRMKQTAFPENPVNPVILSKNQFLGS
jgi:hypothetical protein